VSDGQSRVRSASQRKFSHVLVRARQQSHVTNLIKEWCSLDNATLSRLTWLWLAYGAFALVAGQRRLPSVCPFRLFTGHRCPLCGLTRSLNYFMRGKIPSSFREHRVGPILIVGSGILFASAWRSRLATGRAEHVPPRDPGFSCPCAARHSPVTECRYTAPAFVPRLAWLADRQAPRPESQRPSHDALVERLVKLQSTLTSLLIAVDDDARLMDASLGDAHELANDIRSVVKQRVFGPQGPLDLSTYQENYDAFERSRVHENDMYEVYADDLERLEKRQRMDLGVAQSDSDKLALVQRRRVYISTLTDFQAQVLEILRHLRELISSP
jgi:Protein of unknown function (DUF2752)